MVKKVVDGKLRDIGMMARGVDDECRKVSSVHPEMKEEFINNVREIQRLADRCRTLLKNGTF